MRKRTSELKLNETIATLRSILSERPEQETWKTLCLLLDQIEDRDEQNICLDYVQQHITQFKESIRRPLYRWWKMEQKNESHPCMKMVSNREEWLWTKGSYPGEVRELDCLPDAKIVWVPSGNFLMGAGPNDKGRTAMEAPQHEVLLWKGFWLWQTPVTQKQFHKLLGYNPSEYEGEDRPVDSVTWYETLAFCNALSEKMGREKVYNTQGTREVTRGSLRSKYRRDDGKNYYRCHGWRLPTDAEWEYACRANSVSAFYGELRNIGWYYWNTKDGETQPARQKKPNNWNLFDMVGNVQEWVFDGRPHRYFYDIPRKQESNPVRVAGKHRIIRGGSFSRAKEFCRAGSRMLEPSAYYSHDLGFRIALSM